MDPIVIGETYIFTRLPEYEGDPLDSQVLKVTDIDNGIIEAEDADGDEGEFRMANRVGNYSQLNTRRQWTAARIVERILTTPRRMTPRMPRFLTTTPRHMVESISQMMNVEGGRRKRRVSRKKLSRKKSRKTKKSRTTRR